MTMAALSVIEMMYITDAALLLQLRGINLLTGDYRSALTLATAFLALANFVYFNSRRDLLTDSGNISPTYRAFLTMLLVLPLPLLLVALIAHIPSS